MVAPERQIELTHTHMMHSGGTKHYALYTLSSESGNAVGLQLWGSVGELNGHKIIKGSKYTVDQAQLTKRNEKEKVRKGENYRISGKSSGSYPMHKLRTILLARLTSLAPSTGTRTIDEIVQELMREFGESYAVAAEEIPQQEATKTKEATKKAREESGADYGGSWGAW